jgi:hypothetical protein
VRSSCRPRARPRRRPQRDNPRRSDGHNYEYGGDQAQKRQSSRHLAVSLPRNGAHLRAGIFIGSRFESGCCIES